MSLNGDEAWQKLLPQHEFVPPATSAPCRADECQHSSSGPSQRRARVATVQAVPHFLPLLLGSAGPAPAGLPAQREVRRGRQKWRAYATKNAPASRVSPAPTERLTNRT